MQNVDRLRKQINLQVDTVKHVEEKVGKLMIRRQRREEMGNTWMKKLYNHGTKE